ncbi:MAG: zinc ribbon domain-containing protein [Lachnospiraceae bacterium]|nr:zinc ribbon domain-containing protein [Lachnospiraceae bacterium]
MKCNRCGTVAKDGQLFCTECGASLEPGSPDQQVAPAPAPEPVRQDVPVQHTQPSKKPNVGLIILLVLIAIIAIIITIVSLFIFRVKKEYEKYSEEISTEYEDPRDDIDLDKLNEQIEAMKDLELNTDLNVEYEDPEIPDININDDETEEKVEGDLTKYSYADVIRNGNQLKVTPNGGLSSSTEIFSGKDLDGFLDYVDSTVLEPGRTIDRDFFYAMLSCMLVDKDLNSDKENIESNMVMSLAMANNFHDLGVKINSCDLDATNAAEYRYNVTAGDRDDIWLVNYQDRTVFFNDGKTSYHSDMFKDEYLAVWLMAIEEYYGL